MALLGTSAAQSVQAEGPLCAIWKSVQAEGPLCAIWKSVQAEGPLCAIWKSVQAEGPLCAIRKKSAIARACRGILLAVVLAGIAAASSLSAKAVNEYEVKAAFLYNFARFVEWPEQTFRNDKDPLRICVLGEDPFGSALRDTVNGKSLAGRSFAVADVPDAAAASGCQILFISASERTRFKSILATHRLTGVLTVGEAEGFCKQGGVVNFKLDGGRVGFEINVEAAAQANLRVDPKVLSLAQIVKSAQK